MKYGLFLFFLDKGVPPLSLTVWQFFWGGHYEICGGNVQLGKGAVLLWNWASLNWWGFCLFFGLFCLNWSPRLPKLLPELILSIFTCV